MAAILNKHAAGELWFGIKKTEASWQQEIQSALALRGREIFEARYLKPALEAAFIERTIPEKPNSRLQNTA